MLCFIIQLLIKFSVFRAFLLSYDGPFCCWQPIDLYLSWRMRKGPVDKGFGKTTLMNETYFRTLFTLYKAYINYQISFRIRLAPNCSRFPVMTFLAFYIIFIFTVMHKQPELHIYLFINQCIPNRSVNELTYPTVVWFVLCLACATVTKNILSVEVWYTFSHCIFSKLVSLYSAFCHIKCCSCVCSLSHKVIY